MTEKLLFIALAGLLILSQVIHVYYTFNSFSRLKGWLRELQSVAFCTIISVAIFGFVLIEKPILALFGAFVEVVFNIYYYTLDFWKQGFPHTRHQDEKKRMQAWKNSIATFWRVKWIQIFVAILMPAFIYIFSHIIVNVL